MTASALDQSVLSRYSQAGMGWDDNASTTANNSLRKTSNSKFSVEETVILTPAEQRWPERRKPQE
jgi:hypothetical protein